MTAVKVSSAPPVRNTNGGPEFNLQLFQPPSDRDWSRAIHHDLNIKRRTCTTFIPKDRSSIDSGRDRSEIQCACNRRRREHSWDVFDDDGTRWNRNKHTRSAYNNAFGHLPHGHASYIRCDIDTKPSTLAKLMFDVWKVKEPRLIMCIIGGAKYFKLNERLEREFIKGIIQAASKADGWMVTAGFKTGVVKLVGEAIHDHKVTNPKSQITAIGCSKWGAVKNRQSLIITKSSNVDPTLSGSGKEKGQQDLEPNHTHFLLVDDGTYYGYDIGDYRTRFVVEASRFNARDVPIVTIVVEGGPDTLIAIYRDLVVGIPVVLIDGSGRVPSLLSTFLTRTESIVNRANKEDAAQWKQIVDINNNNDVERLKEKFHSYIDEIRDGLKDISKGSKTSEKEMNEFLNYFLYCLQPAARSKIRIFSLDSDHPLYDTIFEAIIQAKQQKSSETNEAVNRAQLLELALAWDTIDIAKEHIIKDDLSDLSDKTRKKLFCDALKLDRPQFVNTFLKLNFDVSTMFYTKQTNKPWKIRWADFEDLYKDTDIKRKDRLYLLNKCNGNNPIGSLQELDRVLRQLIGDYMKSIYTRSPKGCFERLQRCCQCFQGTRISDSRTNLITTDDSEENTSNTDDPEEAQRGVQQKVYRDLFFWAILTNRIEMTKVLLSHMKPRICGALIASKVLKAYLKVASDNESKDTLAVQADQFEDYARECLTCCYNYEEEKACEIAIRRIKLFGGLSCLQVAVNADDKNFVGHACCDQLLNNIWYDQMEPFQTSIPQRVKIFISVCTLGLLAPVLINFREGEVVAEEFDFERKDNYALTVNQMDAGDDDDDERKRLLPRQTARLNHRGINYSDNYVERSNKYARPFFTYFRRLKQFHQSPMIKFTYNAASYIFFLLLFSYYLLFNFQSPTDEIPSIHWTEILVIIMVSTMLIEDIRQFLCQDNRSMVGKFSNFFITNMFFSVIRVTSYVLFYIGLILRFANASTDADFSAAKIVLAYDLEIWFIRSLSFLGIARKMGPKLVMIRKMVIDLFFFIYIIIIAMTGYGVASRSMYPYDNDTDTDDLTFDGRSIFRHIIYPSYYLMYGSTDNELGALNENPDLSTAIATQVLLAFHMLFVNILLINLLIAMFSFTFESVQTQTDLVWRYERYTLIREYFDRPPLFPPFIIFTHLIELVKLILRHLPRRNQASKNTSRAKTFKMIATSSEIDTDWSEFESYATNRYARRIITGQPTSAAALVPSKIHQEALDSANASELPSNFDLKTITDEITSIKRVVGDLRIYAEEMNRSMQWMMDAMERVKMSRDPKPRLRPIVTTNDLRSGDD